MNADPQKVRYLPSEQNQKVMGLVAHGSALCFEGWATEIESNVCVGAPYRKNAPLCATALPAPPAPASQPSRQATGPTLSSAFRRPFLEATGSVGRRGAEVLSRQAA